MFTLSKSMKRPVHVLLQVSILEEKLSEAMLLEYELEQARQAHGGTETGVCRHCHRLLDGADDDHAPVEDLLREVEHDAPLLLSQAKAVKMEGGGSLYSSSESLNKVRILVLVHGV